MIGIDTNVLVRYVAQDDATQAAIATRFIEETLSREQPGHISLVALAELVWVLRTRYDASRPEIARTLEVLLTAPRLRVQDEAAVWIAVDEYDAGPADFADALIAALGRVHGCSHTVTFDRKATRITGMTLLQ
ncbi:type II toxin-antitoxin system VapC family toxin [soil metagenome]